jgi:purine-binding chemotaxis protein CheW
MRCVMFRDGAARVLVFRVGAERFALPLSDVDEVIDAQSVQRVPDAADSLLGVTSVRGVLLPVYDPRPLLLAAGGVNGAMLVFTRRGERMALAVDDVFDPLTIAAHQVLPVPGGAASDGILTGVIRQGTELVGLLDTTALFDAATVATQGERP